MTAWFFRRLVGACLLLQCTSYITFPVHVNQHYVGANLDEFTMSSNFALRRTQNPWKALREFCFAASVLAPYCATVRDYLTSTLQAHGEFDVYTTLPSYEDDVILHTAAHSGPSSPYLVWSTINLPIDLSQLNGGGLSAVLVLRAYETNVDGPISLFCANHKLKGKHCRNLTFEVRNYLTSLYLRPGGVTLYNMLEGMHYGEYLDFVMFLTDVEKPDGNVGRYYYAQYPTYFLMTAATFCVSQSLDRVKCTAFMQRTHEQLSAYYDSNSGELLAPLYVMHSISTIVQQHSNSNRSLIDKIESTMATNATTTATSSSSSFGDTIGDFIDADFIEIGTSNFNTITQLVDDADALRGFAVEPSIHYLNSLPDKTGVTKVNCAIISAPESGTAQDTLQPTTVDLYYIPETVIAESGLPDYFKGCNSIGDYHPLHKKGNVQSKVVIDKVPAYTIAQLLLGHRIRRIRLLKVDAEGYDLTIISELYQYIVARNDPVLYPERIVFETNDASQDAALQELLGRFRALGYRMVLLGEDTIMERLQDPAAPDWVIAS